jgi:uncharacterized protein YndB with AHSA1/START domain
MSHENPKTPTITTEPPTVRVTDEKTRAFDISIDIAADPGTVWNALTDAGELVRWFPLEARVTPGAGGTMFWGWGDQWDWEHRIDAWEPGKRLRLVQDRYVPFDVHGKPMSEGRVRPVPVAIEVTLEAHAGSTRLRLVHSGFERGGDWDDEFEGVSTGWQSELRNLRFYVERHSGRDRVAAMARQSTTEPRGTAWRRVLTDGFALDAPVLAEGHGYAVKTPAGEQLSGKILMVLPEKEFSGAVRELEDGVFRVATHRAGGETGVMVWLSSYRVSDAGRVEAFRKSSQQALDRLFAGN